MGFKVTTIPAVGAVSARPRKEPLYDTEGYNNGVAMPTLLTLFANAAAFATGGLALTKTLGRDTNTGGITGTLPAAHMFYFYGWRHKVRPLDADLNAAANVVVPTEIYRMRTLAWVTFRYAQSDYVTVQADELPDGVGPMFIQTTHGGSTVLSIPNGVPDRRNFKDMTVSGKPPEINALEQFRVRHELAASPFNPTVELYVTTVLEGLLLRGVTG